MPLEALPNPGFSEAGDSHACRLATRVATIGLATVLWTAAAFAQPQWGTRSYEEERPEYFALVKQLEREANQLLSRIRQVNNHTEAFLGRYSEQERHALVQKYEAGDDYRNRHRLLEMRLEQERDAKGFSDDSRKAHAASDERRPEVRADLWTKHIAWRQARVEARKAQLALLDSRLVVMQGEVGIDWEAFWADNAEDILSVYGQVMKKYPEDVGKCLMSVGSSQLGSYLGGRLGPGPLVEPAPVPIVPNLLLKVGKDCVVGAGYRALVNAFEAAWRKQFLDAMRDHGVMEGVAEYWWEEIILAELPGDDALLDRLKGFIADEAEQAVNETVMTTLGQGLTRYVAERELPELKRRYGSLIAAANKADMKRQMLSSAQQQAEDRLDELTKSASLLVDYTQKAAELYYNSRTFSRIEANELARYRRIVECLRTGQQAVTAEAVVARLELDARAYARFAATCGLVEVPPMNGLLVAEARKLLESRGLGVREEEAAGANPDPRNDGRVKEHRPESRKKVPLGAEVTLVVWPTHDREARCASLRDDFNGAVADRLFDQARRLLTGMKNLSCDDIQGSERFLDVAEARFRDRVLLPSVVGLKTERALEVIEAAGFRIQLPVGIRHEKTGDRAVGGTVKSQQPPGQTLQIRGATVEITTWQFDPYVAEAETDCSAISGSQARWNDDLGKAECACVSGVKLRARQGGLYCAGCDEVRVFFDRELAAGNQARARHLLDVVAGSCGWHEDGQAQIVQSQQLGQAEQACRRSKPGSRAVATADGYVCRCPQGSVEADVGRGVSCQSCDAMKTYFDGEVGKGNARGAQALLSLSSGCGWHAQGQMQLGQLSEQVQLAQAQASCAQNAPGTRAVKSGSGYHCVCPVGTIQVSLPRPGCLSCSDAQRDFNAALQQGNQLRANQILFKSLACPWYMQGQQALTSSWLAPTQPAPPVVNPYQPASPVAIPRPPTQPTGPTPGSRGIDVSGTWLVTYSSPRRDIGLGIQVGGPGSFEVTLTQNGTQITGMARGPEGDTVSVFGTISGNSITLNSEGAEGWEAVTGTVGPDPNRMGGRHRTDRRSANLDGTWSAVRQEPRTQKPNTAPSRNPDCARLAREYYDHCANKREREWNAVFSRAQSLGCTQLDPMRCFKLQFELDVPPIEEVVPPMQPIVRPPNPQ